MKTIMMSFSLWNKVRSLAKNDPERALSNRVLEKNLSATEGAACNVRTTLQFFGIIDPEFHLTEFGTKWIDDNTYQEACQEIIERVFPLGTYDALQPGGELSDFSMPNTKQWLRNRAGLADPRKNASFLLKLAAEAGIRPTPIEKAETPMSAIVSITAEIPFDKLSDAATMLASVAVPNSLSINIQTMNDGGNR